jgi:hypothetical protein
MDSRISRGISVATRAVIGASLLGVLSFVAVGCGGKVEMRVVDPMGKTTQSERDKITANLEAAGIKGEIYNVVDNDKEWIVDVGAPKPPPGKRASPSMPITYLVNKESGKVSTTGIQ